MSVQYGSKSTLTVLNPRARRTCTTYSRSLAVSPGKTLLTGLPEAVRDVSFRATPPQPTNEGLGLGTVVRWPSNSEYRKANDTARAMIRTVTIMTRRDRNRLVARFSMLLSLSIKTFLTFCHPTGSTSSSLTSDCHFRPISRIQSIGSLPLQPETTTSVTSSREVTA